MVNSETEQRKSQGLEQRRENTHTCIRSSCVIILYQIVYLEEKTEFELGTKSGLILHIHIHTHACIYICTKTQMWTHTYNLCIYTYLCAYIHTYTHSWITFPFLLCLLMTYKHIHWPTLRNCVLLTSVGFSERLLLECISDKHYVQHCYNILQNSGQQLGWQHQQYAIYHVSHRTWVQQ